MVIKRTFFILWLLCIAGALSILPYVLAIGVVPPTVSITKMVLFGTLQAAVVFALICWLSYKILPKTDLHPFVATQPMKRIVYPALIWGVAVGLAIFLFDRTMFGTDRFAEVHAPLWTGALASFYGAINEEVQLRLFLFTLLYFVWNRCCKGRAGNKFYALWAVTILVALMFGIGHLPVAYKVTSPSALEVFRIIFLNGIGGIVFGWLYWSRGLWAAMAAHFVADLMIHVFLV